jgi:hypothetical protein
VGTRLSATRIFLDALAVPGPKQHTRLEHFRLACHQSLHQIRFDQRHRSIECFLRILGRDLLVDGGARLARPGLRRMDSTRTDVESPSEV